MSYTLRDLPLPVKVVATVFLLAVGAGYTSAMLQLHIQDSKSGKPMPTPEDVVLKFTGKKKFDPNAPPPQAPASRLEALVLAPSEEINGNTMAGAFTTQDRGPKPIKFSELIKTRPEAEVRAERKGEQEAFVLWIRTPDAERKAAYEADKFVPPAGKEPKAITAGLKDGDGVKIKSLINARCATCHSKGGEKEEPALDTYAGLVKFVPPPAAPPVPDKHGYIKVEEPISISKLTQSTHAHLLSFAMLFSLTGLIFALSSWPAWMRVIVGPSVVIAVFADVSCWWLARLCDEMGPFFAQAVILTGFLAGVGLFTHIAGSLFTMYGLKGRAVIGLLFVLGALGGGAFTMKLLVPALPKPKVEEKKEEIKQPEEKKEEKKDTVTGDVAGKAASGAGGAVADGMTKVQGGTPVVAAPRKPVNELDRLLIWPPVDPEGKPVDPAGVKFKGGDDGNMAAAFFEKDKAYKKVMDGPEPQAVKDKLKAHREGDLQTMLAWVRSPDPVRKSAYDANKFELPGLSDKALTPEFVKDGKVLIKTLIDNRCATCHGPDGKQADYPLDSYKGLSEYLKAFDAPAPKDTKGEVPAPPADPKLTKPAAPIPPAKDD